MALEWIFCMFLQNQKLERKTMKAGTRGQRIKVETESEKEVKFVHTSSQEMYFYKLCDIVTTHRANW